MLALSLLAGTLLAALLAQPAGATEVPAKFARQISGEALDPRLFDEAVRFFSNAARRQHGRAPLAGDAALARAAGEHARNMARLRTHSHVLPVRGQKNLSDRMHRQSVDFRLAAENIAMDKMFRLLGRPISMSSRGCDFIYGDTREPVPLHTYGSLAQQVVARWLASPGHRASLLSSEFRRLGAGVGVDPGGSACGDLYLVQDFAD